MPDNFLTPDGAAFPEVYQIEKQDGWVGGPGGLANKQGQSLADRTEWLKLQIIAALSGLSGHETDADPHPQYLTSAEGNAAISSAVAALVAASPSALDTLNELASALGNDANFATTMTNALAGKAAKDGDTGLIRTLTPPGGARVRELGDITNAATVGGIEIGISYNCSINTATGVWAGRDIADICWLEKWHDVAGTKEFWFAPTGVANAVPVWTKIFAIDMVNGTVTLPTPAKFDNTTKAATTAFVQGALGSLSGFLTLNANVTLTAAHAGRGCYFSAAAIATLPLANTVPAGTLIYFTSATTGATSVARQSTDSIAASSGSSALNSMVLLDGEDLILESNGNNQWIAVGGSARLKFAGAFGASITSNGYQKLPGGLILQWGTAACAAGSAVVTFPLAFSVAPFIHGYMNNQTSTSGATTVSVSASTTGMSVASSVAAMSGSWFAIGK